MVKETEYYERLRVSPESECTPEELTQSWIQIARENNPNMVGDLRTEEFKKISKAFNVLKDPFQRKFYDQFGKEAFETSSNAPRKRANPISYNLYVTMEELQQGVTKSFVIPTCKICKDCDGTGIEEVNMLCLRCFGVGSTFLDQSGNFLNERIPCVTCSGAGRKTTDRCIVCAGVGATATEHHESVTLCSTMENGHQIIVKHRGNELPGVERGHVEFTIHILEKGVVRHELAVGESEEFKDNFYKEETEPVSTIFSDGDEDNKIENEEEMQHERVDERKSSSNDDGNQEEKVESHIPQTETSDVNVISLSDQTTIDESSSFPAPMNSITSEAMDTISDHHGLTSNSPVAHDAIVETADAQIEGCSTSCSGNEIEQNLPSSSKPPISEDPKHAKQQEDRNDSKGGNDNIWAPRLRVRKPDWMLKFSADFTKDNADVTNSANESPCQKKQKTMDPATSASKGKKGLLAGKAIEGNVGQNRTESKLESVAVPTRLVEIGRIRSDNVNMLIVAWDDNAEDKFLKCVSCTFLIPVPKESPEVMVEKARTIHEMYMHFTENHYEELRPLESSPQPCTHM